MYYFFDQRCSKCGAGRFAMTISVEDYIDLRIRLNDLGCIFPSNIAILPVNIQSAATRADLLQRAEAATVRTLFRNSDIHLEDVLPTDERAAYIQNNAFEWVAPTLFVGASVWSSNPTAVNIAINVISNYISDFLRGIPSHQKTVKIEIVVEKTADCSFRSLKYEGNIDGLAEIPETIRVIAND